MKPLIALRCSRAKRQNRKQKFGRHKKVAMARVRVDFRAVISRARAVLIKGAQVVFQRKVLAKEHLHPKLGKA